MKTINLKSVKLKEIVIQPNNEGVALNVRYEILDDNDEVVFVKQKTVNRTDFGSAGQTAITNFAAKILAKIKTAEGL